jgi:hypothetical protein
LTKAAKYALLPELAHLLQTIPLERRTENMNRGIPFAHDL